MIVKTSIYLFSIEFKVSDVGSQNARFQIKFTLYSKSQGFKISEYRVSDCRIFSVFK